MKPNTLSLILTLILGLISSASLRAADEPSPTETKLRDALRATMLQLRQVQNDNATLQAAQAASDQQNQALQAKVDAQGKQISALVKEAAETKADTDKQIEALTATNADQAKQLSEYLDALTRWKAAYLQAAGIAREKEAERAASASQVIVLQRQVDGEKDKNIQLYKLGSEVLTRYEKFSLGDAITAKEPFVGVTRVKLENLVQEYEDKMAAQKIVTTSP